MADETSETPNMSAAARAASASASAARNALAAQPDPTEPAEDEVPPQAELRKKELIDRVAERSGIKRKDAKPVVEAMLTVLGETIGEGRELSLQPFGKLRVTRTKEMPNGKVMVARIRQSGPALEELEQVAAVEGEISAKEPLAEDAD
ncbi:DNA-binding protein [Pseudooceanicola antarcticus]|uniref:DNA-binding protein n=2 Tax=Pseudooceanicola antarcticus TaxID=1247613 RepID=A0A285J1I4_9RHOB|nr:HU family DNA-binding protein [Pseudooceanicola antarcticus]SNY54072.1 DNA-binding protein [Pseudooceanicola antarcticus]